MTRVVGRHWQPDRPTTVSWPEAHDGRIELVSARGEGSTFTLVLPAGTADPVSPMEPVDPAVAGPAELIDTVADLLKLPN